MGGLGSGEWCRFKGKKRTVEECLTLDVNRLARDGTLARFTSGTISWNYSQPGRASESIGFSVRPDGEWRSVLRLQYCAGENNIDLPIELQSTCPRFGGRRWWFTCPLIVNGVACRRRVAKLYLRGRYFGCRHCHDLTYRSSQEAHKKERSAAFWDKHGAAFQALMRRWETR